MLKAAASITTKAGPLAFGPKCARAAGIAHRACARTMRMAGKIAQDRETVDWVEDMRVTCEV